MNWDAIGAIAELSGAFAVVASLVYFALQLRQASAHVKGAAYQSALQGRTALRVAFATDMRLASLYQAGLEDIESLDATDRLRLHVFLVEEFRIIQFAYYLFKRGLADPEIWEHELHVIGTYRNTTGFRQWWAESHGYYSSEFLALVDSTVPQSTFGQLDAWRTECAT